MSDGTKISWSDATWNPIVGCTKVSPGCDHCYAIRTAHRMTANPNPLVSQAYAGTEAGGEWTGKVNLLADRLDQPLRWRRPRRIFVNAQSDLFHEAVPDDFIARVWAVMTLAPNHVFQVLTKRHARMRSLLSAPRFQDDVWRAATALMGDRPTSNPKHLTQFHWQVGGTAASPIIQALLPYLRIKRDRALLVLDFQAELDEAREHRPEGGVPWLPVGHARTATFSQRVDEIRAAGRELDGRTWDEYPA